MERSTQPSSAVPAISWSEAGLPPCPPQGHLPQRLPHAGPGHGRRLPFRAHHRGARLAAAAPAHPLGARGCTHQAESSCGRCTACRGGGGGGLAPRRRSGPSTAAAPAPACLQIFGPEASGKTTLALHAIAEVQKRGGIACFVDAEHAFDQDYAQVRAAAGCGAGCACLAWQPHQARRPLRRPGRQGEHCQPPCPDGAVCACALQRLGINIKELLVSQPDCGEQALCIADELVSSEQGAEQGGKGRDDHAPARRPVRPPSPGLARPPPLLVHASAP